MERDRQIKKGIPNALTGVSPSAGTPQAPTKYDLNEIDIIIAKQSKLLLDIELSGIDSKYFHNKVYDLLDCYLKTMEQQGKHLDAQSQQTRAECEKASNKAIKVIDEWRYEVRNEHQDAARLRDQTAKLVASLKGCDTKIRKSVSEGISKGIFSGNKLLLGALVTIGLNILILSANIVLALL